MSKRRRANVIIRPWARALKSWTEAEERKEARIISTKRELMDRARGIEPGIRDAMPEFSSVVVNFVLFYLGRLFARDKE